MTVQLPPITVERWVSSPPLTPGDASGLCPDKVVTEVSGRPLWEAEPEHQDYLERNPGGHTCHFVRPDWKLPGRGENDT